MGKLQINKLILPLGFWDSSIATVPKVKFDLLKPKAEIAYKI